MSLVRGIVSAELEDAYDKGYAAFFQECYKDEPQFCPFNREGQEELNVYWHYGYDYNKSRRFKDRAKMREWYLKKQAK